MIEAKAIARRYQGTSKEAPPRATAKKSADGATEINEMLLKKNTPQKTTRHVKTHDASANLRGRDTYTLRSPLSLSRERRRERSRVYVSLTSSEAT